MASFLMKKWIGNEFDKVVKEFDISDGKVEQDGISGEELMREENRRAEKEKERNARHEKIQNKREESRQKIRDKYNITKKGDDSLSATKKQEQGKVDDSITPVNNENGKLEKINGPEPQGFEPMKTMSNTFSNVKRKFGWK